jgi:hypothetical protein
VNDGCSDCYRKFFDSLGGEELRCVTCDKAWDRPTVARMLPTYTRKVRVAAPLADEHRLLADTTHAAYVRSIVAGFGTRKQTIQILNTLDAFDEWAPANRALNGMRRFYKRMQLHCDQLMTNAAIERYCAVARVELHGPGAGVGVFMYDVDLLGREQLEAAYAHAPVVQALIRSMDPAHVSMWTNGGRVTYDTLDNAFGRVNRDGVHATDVRSARPLRCGTVDCTGVVDKTTGCSSCGKRRCDACMDMMSAEEQVSHVCDAGVLASIKAARASGTPCPECSMPINRVDGCSTMLCMNCGTFFNYITGKVLAGTNHHNPHVAEWRARNAPTHETAIVAGCGVVLAVCHLNLQGQTLRCLWRDIQQHETLIDSGKIGDYLERIRFNHWDDWCASHLRACMNPAHVAHVQRLLGPDGRIERNYTIRVQHLVAKTSIAAFERAIVANQRSLELQERYCSVFADFTIAQHEWLTSTIVFLMEQIEFPRPIHGLSTHNVERIVTGQGHLTIDVCGRAHGMTCSKIPRVPLDIVMQMKARFKVYTNIVAFFSERVEEIGRLYGTTTYRLELDSYTLRMKRVIGGDKRKTVDV